MKMMTTTMMIEPEVLLMTSMDRKYGKTWIVKNCHVTIKIYFFKKYDL